MISRRRSCWATAVVHSHSALRDYCSCASHIDTMQEFLHGPLVETLQYAEQTRDIPIHRFFVWKTHARLWATVVRCSLFAARCWRVGYSFIRLPFYIVQSMAADWMTTRHSRTVQKNPVVSRLVSNGDWQHPIKFRLTFMCTQFIFMATCNAMCVHNNYIARYVVNLLCTQKKIAICSDVVAPLQVRRSKSFIFAS